MAVVQVTLIAAHRQHGHKHAVIRCGDRRVVLPVTNPTVEHSNFALDWQQVPRPDDRPLLGDNGRQLHVAKLNATVAAKDGASVESTLVDLLNISRDPTNFAAVKHWGYLEAGPWRLTDITITSQMRKFGTNQITRAQVALTLTEAVPEPGPRATKKQTKSKSGPKRPKTYTVTAGDTLSAIAARFYGDANEWHKIAHKNHIRHPHRLRIGRVLKLP